MHTLARIETLRRKVQDARPPNQIVERSNGERCQTRRETIDEECISSKRSERGGSRVHFVQGAERANRDSLARTETGEPREDGEDALQSGVKMPGVFQGARVLDWWFGLNAQGGHEITPPRTVDVGAVQDRGAGALLHNDLLFGILSGRQRRER